MSTINKQSANQSQKLMVFVLTWPCTALQLFSPN